MHEECFIGFTSINDDEIYIKLICKGECNDNWVEFRMAYYDFDNHIREEIRHIIISDFGSYEWELGSSYSKKIYRITFKREIV